MPRRITREDGIVEPSGPPEDAAVAYPAAVRQRLLPGARLRRIFWPAAFGATALGFRTNGPRARFDHHRRPGPFPSAADGADRGIAYASPHLDCCVAECFGDDGIVDADGAHLAVLALTAPLVLREHPDLQDVHGLLFSGAHTGQDLLAEITAIAEDLAMAVL